MIAYLAILIVVGCVYLLPTMIASARTHPNVWLVAAINVMTGLTVFGWFFALREALKPLPGLVIATQRTGFAGPALPSSRPISTTFSIPRISDRRKQMSFFAAISLCFSNYLTFSGRASRSEYWFFFLFCILVGVPIAFFGPVAISLLAILVPAISVEVRRLHDTDRSGWWFWIGAVPLIGILLKLYWYCQSGTVGENRFGPDPLALDPPGKLGFAARPSVSMTDRAEQLAKIKALLESGAISQPEFDKLKNEILAG